MAWKLRPSKRRVLVGNGAVMSLIPLWETPNGLLVWPKRGIRGDRLPAGAASGQVPCEYATDPAIVPVNLMGGCPRDGYVEAEHAEGSTETVRQLIVRGEDAVFEPVQVLVVDELRLS